MRSNGSDGGVGVAEDSARDSPFSFELSEVAVPLVADSSGMMRYEQEA